MGKLIMKLGYFILAVLLLSAPLCALISGRAFSSQLEWSLTLGTIDSVETCLDPALAFDYFGWEIIRNLGSGLVSYRLGTTGDLEVMPALATSWAISSDGLIWTFNLREGVAYDDGTEFNASHVKYTFDRGMGIADPGGPFLGIGYSDLIQNVTVVSEFVVKFYLKTPFAPFLSLLALPPSYIVDPRYSSMHGTSWSTNDVVFYTEGNARASNPMGLGPYRLANWTRVAGKDSEMILVANPFYWDTGAGYQRNTKATIKFYADSTSLVSAVRSHEIDVASRVGLSEIDSMNNDPSLHVWEGNGAFIQYLCLQEKYWPFNETNIRQAVASAVNRTALVNTVFQGRAQSLFSLIPNGLLGHADSFQSLGDPNYTRTLELLAPYGFNETNKFTFGLWYESSGLYPQSFQQALVLKASMEASGVITVNLQALEWAAMGNARRAGTMEAFIYGWYPDYVDPDDYVYPFLHSIGGSWLQVNYANPVMDRLVEWARGNISTSVRESLYQQIQDLTVSDCPIVPLYQSLQYVVTSSNIGGISLDITQSLRIWLIAKVQANLPSDINSDGTVDIHDALLLAAAFGSNPQSSKWNFAADINHDNIIDIFDLIILAKNFGEHYP